MALTFASYAAPGHERPVAIAAVLALTAVNYRGLQKSTRLTRVIVALTLATLLLVTVAALAGGTASTAHLSPFPGTSIGGVLFFAFAGVRTHRHPR